MSISQPKYKPVNDIMITTNSCKTPISLANLVDNVNNNNLHVFYPKEDSLFKKKIDKLNLKFYLETEKYLSNQHNEKKCQESLFIILFQQISLYIEEIERLNLLLQEKKGDPRYIKEKVDEYIRKQKDFETKELLIKTLKQSKINAEQRLSELMNIEDKIKTENESLKRQNKFYQDKLKYYLQNQIEDISSSQLEEGVAKQNNNNNKNDPSIQSLYNDQYNPNQSIKIPKKLSKKRNYSDNNPPIQTINSKMQNEVNAFRGINRYSNNLSNGNNSVDHNGNKLNNRLTKKNDFKIIKAVKEQLSGDLKNKTGDLNQSPRCQSPMISREEYKSTIMKIEKELGEIATMEQFLQEFKKELLYENFMKADMTIQFDHFSSKDNMSNEHMKTEVVSDLEEDYDGSRSPIIREHKQFNNNAKINKQYTLLNSVTIDLNSPNEKDKDKEKELRDSNGKSKSSHNSNLRHIISSTKKKKEI